MHEGLQQRSTYPYFAGYTKVHATFVNRVWNTEVAIVWVDFQGDEIVWGTIAPGATLQMDTFIGHVWRCYDSTQVYSRAHYVECIMASPLPQCFDIGPAPSLTTPPPLVFCL